MSNDRYENIAEDLNVVNTVEHVEETVRLIDRRVRCVFDADRVSTKASMIVLTFSNFDRLEHIEQDHRHLNMREFEQQLHELMTTVHLELHHGLKTILLKFFFFFSRFEFT